MEQEVEQDQVTRTPLSEVLSSEADRLIIEETQEEVKPVETETVVEEAAPTAEETKPTEVSELDQVKSELAAFKTKAYDEKGKRQALQAQMDSQKQEVEKPDAYVNPDDAIEHGMNQVRAENNERFFNMSESQARGRHNDFDAMNDLFMNEMVVDNPQLGQQAAAAPDPFEFVYQQAKTHHELKDVGSLSDYRVKIENEMRAKFEAEYAGKAKDATEKAISAALPNSLSTATAAGGNQVPTWAGPTSLNSILGQK